MAIAEQHAAAPIESVPLTRQAADWIANIASEDITDRARTWAKHALLDWIAVTLAANNEPLVGMMVEELADDQPGKCTVVGQGRKTTRLNAAMICVDYGYAQRQLEVLQQAYYRRFMPTKGSDRLNLPFKKTYLDPFEGTGKQGETSVATLSFNTDIFKMLRMDALKGESDKAWYLYQYPEHELVSQLSSEERMTSLTQIF
jgi:hypothetical protein